MQQLSPKEVDSATQVQILHNFVYISYCSYHHVVPPAWISLTLSRHFSLLFITSGRSSELHPVSSQSCCMYVRASRPAFARPYVGVHRSTSFMSSSLLLQQCSACLVRLTWIVFVMGGTILNLNFFCLDYVVTKIFTPQMIVYESLYPSKLSIIYSTPVL